MITLPEQIIMGRPWVRVECGGVAWDVAPDYVAPVGITEALLHAEAAGCELPSRELVDAVFAAADLRVEPLPRHHDGTPATMASAEVYADQARRIEAQIAGRPYRLLVGTHKDVILYHGKPALYGWHRPSGAVIQPVFAGHGGWHKDYSQGLRLCRRVGVLVADEVGSPAGEDPPPEAA